MNVFPVLLPRHTQNSSATGAPAARQRQARDVFVGIIGLAALLLYILACRPSWSPDGTKVVFPYYNPETKERGAALYDRTTGTVRSILAVSERKPAPVDAAKEHSWGEGMCVVAQFTHDGRRVIVSWNDEKSHTLLLPVAPGEATRSFVLPAELGVDDAPTLVPYPEIGGNLFLAGGKAIVRLNMQTGATQYRQLEDGFEGTIAAQGNRVLYVREVEETQPKQEPLLESKPEAKKEEEKAEVPAPAPEKAAGSKFEFGTVNPGDLTLKPLFTLTSGDLEARGIEEVQGFLSPEPRGSRMAMTDKGAQRLVVLNSSGIERVVQPNIVASVYMLGNFEWAPGGNKLYAPVIAKNEPDKDWQFSIAEIALDSGGTRLTPIARVRGDDLLQIALSPDGSTIATTTADLKDVAMADRALYLVNLRDPKRAVTKIPMPGVKKATAPAPQAKP